MIPVAINPSITERQDESLKMYFREVSCLSLLTPEQEKQLSDRIKNGDEKAVHELMLGNLRFAIAIAKQYQNKGLPLVDLIQEANIGLLHSCRTFDADKGAKFTTYAVWWIKQAITNAISEHCRTVRVPVSQILYNNKVKKIANEFEQENHRQPSFTELEDRDINIDKMLLSTKANDRSLSLDNVVDDEVSLIDVIPCDDCTEDTIYDNNRGKVLIEILNSLSSRDCDIVKMVFGIEMDNLTNEEIANRFGISTERVRQIKENTLKFLRDHYSQILKELL